MTTLQKIAEATIDELMITHHPNLHQTQETCINNQIRYTIWQCNTLCTITFTPTTLQIRKPSHHWLPSFPPIITIDYANPQYWKNLNHTITELMNQDK